MPAHVSGMQKVIGRALGAFTVWSVLLPALLFAQPGERVLGYGTDGELVVPLDAGLTFQDSVAHPPSGSVISAFLDESDPSNPRVRLGLAEVAQANAWSLPTYPLDVEKNSRIRLAVDSQGRLLVAATRYRTATELDVHVMRIDSGAVDASFGPPGAGGVAAAPFTTAQENRGLEILKDIHVLSDGRIVLLAETAIAHPTHPFGFGLVFLSGDGTPDPAISQGWGDGRVHLGFDESVMAEAVTEDANGRIVVLGWRDRTAGGQEMLMARLLPTGSLDSSFSGDGLHVLRFRPCATCPEEDDGFYPVDVEVLGPDAYVLATAKLQGSVLARMTDSGGTDPIFGDWVAMPLGSFGGMPAYGQQRAWDLVPDEREGLMILSTIQHPTETSYRRLHIARLRTDGTPDPAFAQGGVLVTQSTAGGRYPGKAVRVLTVHRTPGFVDSPTVTGPYEDPSGTPYNVLRLQGVSEIFSDGFESGDHTAWLP